MTTSTFFTGAPSASRLHQPCLRDHTAAVRKLRGRDWFDGRAAARIDPKGPIFPIEKGEYLNPVRGMRRINESAEKRSLGTVHRIYLYSAFAYPTPPAAASRGLHFTSPRSKGSVS